MKAVWTNVKCFAQACEGKRSNILSKAAMKTFTIWFYMIMVLDYTFSSIQVITTNGCGETVGCLRIPSGCELSQCTFLTTYKSRGGQVTFELFGRNVGWVAIGFNSDQKMIGTDAIFCYNHNGDVLIRSGKLTDLSLPTLKEVSDLKLVNQSTDSGSVFCRFQHPLNPNNTSTLRNLDDRLYLIYAQGQSSASNLNYHGNNARGFSNELVNVSRNVESTAKSPGDLKKRVHGSVMVVVWIFLASTGLFFARYTRNVWSAATILDQKVWFQFHRLLMIAVVLGTVASIVVIFVDLEGFTKGEDKFKTHAILGLVVLSLAILQPIGAIFRPHPGTAKRPIFNFIHRLFGLSAFILSLAAIVFGLDIFNKKNAFNVVLGYVGFLVLVIIIMEVVNFIFQMKKEQTVAEVMPGGMAMDISIAKTNTGQLTLAKVFLAIVLVVSLVVTVVVIYFINDSKN